MFRQRWCVLVLQQQVHCVQAVLHRMQLLAQQLLTLMQDSMQHACLSQSACVSNMTDSTPLCS
jgi:hypothetical protein